MRKIIHSSFELDLSSFKLQDVEQNSIFFDTFFTKYSFPFSIDLVKDLDVAFGFISHYNSASIKTYFDVKYVHNNKIEDAIFEIEEMQQQLSCSLRFGFDELPSFSKKLSELPLDNFALPSGTTIYEHAESIITQTWPNVNYNFPQIHTDRYDAETDDYFKFRKIINNRVQSSFPQNSVTIERDEFERITEVVNINQNILQPIPYILHLVQKGFEAANLTLSGTILNDVLLQKACVYPAVDYVKIRPQELINKFLINGNEHVLVEPYNGDIKFLTYTSQCNVPNVGLYRVNGFLFLADLNSDPLGSFSFSFFLNDVGVESTPWISTTRYEDIITFELDFYVIITEPNSTFKIIIEQNSTLPDDRIICDVNLLFINPFANGDYVPTLANESKINLTKSVPDATFGDLIKFIKNYLNYDISKIENGLVYMDPIKDSIDYSNSEDFSDYLVKYPIRKFSQGKSFLLKFVDINSEVYTYQPVFHNKDGFVNANYKTDDKTATIEINGFPLPLKNETTANTAHGFEDDSSRFYLVIYDGLYNGNNFSKPISEYLLPNIHLIYWKLWFEKRISAIIYVWSFISNNFKLRDFSIKKTIFAYNNHHKIKTFQKTEIKPDEFEIEIETEFI